MSLYEIGPDARVFITGRKPDRRLRRAGPRFTLVVPHPSRTPGSPAARISASPERLRRGRRPARIQKRIGPAVARSEQP